MKPVLTEINDTHVFTWAELTGTGDAAVQSRTGDRMIQIVGTVNPGDSVQIEGSLDNVNWFILHDPFHLSLTSLYAVGAAILENPPYIRPRIIGSGGTVVTVMLSVRKA